MATRVGRPAKINMKFYKKLKPTLIRREASPELLPGEELHRSEEQQSMLTSWGNLVMVALNFQVQGQVQAQN